MTVSHRYMAASLPRAIRTARLAYLRRDAIIGSKRSAAGAVYDVIMLPAAEFVRARNQLSAASTGRTTLERGHMDTPYIPQDVKEMTVLPGASDPRLAAIRYFRNHFGLPDNPAETDPDTPSDYTPYTEL